MSSTQRLTALGTLCRRPSALLIPLAPLVLLVLAATTVFVTVRAGRAARSVLSSEIADVEPAASTSIARSAGLVAGARPTTRRVLGGTAALMGGILVAAGMAGGTYAFLNSQATTPAVTVSSGNLALTVQYGSTTAGPTTAIPVAAWSNMLPGDVVGQQFTVASTGTATSTVTARLSALTAWDIRIAPGTCPTTQLTSAALTTTAAAQGTISPSTSSVVCVQATLPASAAASVEATTAPFTIIIDATQVPTP
jgi:hypothetical protein